VCVLTWVYLRSLILGVLTKAFLVLPGESFRFQQSTVQRIYTNVYVCVCVYISKDECVGIHVYKQVYRYIHTNIDICICTYTCIHMYMHLYANLFKVLYGHMCVLMQARMVCVVCVCVCTCVWVHVCVWVPHTLVSYPKIQRS